MGEDPDSNALRPPRVAMAVVAASVAEADGSEASAMADAGVAKHGRKTATAAEEQGGTDGDGGGCRGAVSPVAPVTPGAKDAEPATAEEEEVAASTVAVADVVTSHPPSNGHATRDCDPANGAPRAEANGTRDAVPQENAPARAETGSEERSTVPARDDDDLAAETSVEDVHSPEIICLDSDDKDDTQEEEAAASEGSVESSSVAASAQRRRKRARVLGFSHNKQRAKRQGVGDATPTGDAAVVPASTRVRRQRSTDSAALDGADATSTDARGAVVNSGDLVAWDWESCRVYYEPLSQANMDELTSVRRDSARVVCANSHMWGSIRRFEHDDACLVSMAGDVNDDLDHLRVRPLRRGRSFRDAWEEDDFLASQQRPSRTGKKRPFAGCDTISSHRELVRGYDDDLFTAFMAHLEARAGQAHLNNASADANGDVDPVQRIEETATSRRLKTAKRRPAEKDTLPPIPVHHVHPASCGAWKLKGKEKPSYDMIHPGAIRPTKSPQRWIEELERERGEQPQDVISGGLRRSGRHEKPGEGPDEEGPGGDDEEKNGAHEAPSDEAIELPSFGVVMEEDEISREITDSLVRLIELSALNWRRTQTLYERAVSYIEVTPLLQAEEAAKQRLEHLYRTLYPPSMNPDDPDAEYERELKFWRRPRDLVTFAASRSTNALTESLAVSGSVEYALRLKRGEPIDVMDRNGCWNDGVVLDLYSDAGGDVKNVLVSYALWAGDSTEWVPVIEARILPRGVADGRISFTLGPTRGRKRLIHLTRQTADYLQSTYPLRQSARLQVQYGVQERETDNVGATPSRSSSKKQRRR